MRGQGTKWGPLNGSTRPAAESANRLRINGRDYTRGQGFSARVIRMLGDRIALVSVRIGGESFRGRVNVSAESEIEQGDNVRVRLMEANPLPHNDYRLTLELVESVQKTQDSVGEERTGKVLRLVKGKKKGFVVGDYESAGLEWKFLVPKSLALDSGFKVDAIVGIVVTDRFIKIRKQEFQVAYDVRLGETNARRLLRSVR